MTKPIPGSVALISAGPHSAACLKGGRLWWLCGLDQDFNVWTRNVALPSGVAADDVVEIAPTLNGATLVTVSADLWVWDAQSGRWEMLGNVVEPPAHAR